MILNAFTTHTQHNTLLNVAGNELEIINNLYSVKGRPRI